MLPRPIAALVIVCTLTADSLAGTPREELLRYVPDDVGFCLVVQNLRGQLRELAGSPFGLRVRESAGAKALRASAEWGQLKQAGQYLERHLGVNAEKLFDDLLGEAFAFAYRPGPLGKQEDEQGLFLLRARDEKTLAGFVAKINALQKDTGELKALEEVDHKGVKYVRRREAKETNYYYLNGPVLLFSGQELLLRQAVEREKRVEGDSPLLRQMRELKLDDALVGLLLNPRAWDAAVAASKPADPAARMAVRAWKALGGVGVGVHLESDVRVRLSVQVKTEDLPAAARRLFASASKPSAAIQHPEEALLAVSGRLDLAALFEHVGECLTKPARQAMEAELGRTVGAALGRDVVKDLLPAIGPDWGISVTAPPPGAKGWAPQVVAAVKLARGDEADPTDEAVLAAAHSAAMVAVLGHNKQHPEKTIRLRSAVLGGVRVRYLEGDAFPPGVRPAFALKGGHLVLASSPDGVERFKAGAASEEAPLLRSSLKEWRSYLAARREPLAGAVACKDGLTKDKALAKIDEVRAVLELFDRVELRQQTSPGFAAFTLTLTPAAAMKALPAPRP
jgi:hypothetical protein